MIVKMVVRVWHEPRVPFCARVRGVIAPAASVRERVRAPDGMDGIRERDCEGCMRARGWRAHHWDSAAGR